jgi:pimeloyl-ACP methyl ester carboxylesterase
MPETVVLLHGFAGTGRLWDPVVARLDGERYRPLAPDLRGHGTASTRRPVSFEGCVEDVLGLAAHPFTLVGYSMGGRLALLAALAAPERIERLILVATTAGIDDPHERDRRRAGDEALADQIEHATIDDFICAGRRSRCSPTRRRRRWRGGTPTCSRTILPRSPPRCAGSAPARWNRCGTASRSCAMPATVLAGERDAKFSALGQRLADGLPNGELVIIDGAGHGIPREDPAAVAAAIAR